MTWAQYLGTPGYVMTRGNRHEKKGILHQDLPAWIRLLRHLGPLVTLQLGHPHHAEERLQSVLHCVRMGNEPRQHPGHHAHPTGRLLVRPRLDAHRAPHAVHHLDTARGSASCSHWSHGSRSGSGSSATSLHRVRPGAVPREYLYGNLAIAHHRPHAGPRSPGRALTGQRRHQFHGWIRVAAGVLRCRQDLHDQQTAGVRHCRCVSPGSSRHHVPVHQGVA